MGQPSNFPNLSAGTYNGTVDVTESSDGQSFHDSAQFTVTVESMPITAHSVSITPSTGIEWSGALATFTDPDPNANASNYAVTIDYGDGTDTSAGTVSSDGSGGWIVTDSHTFADEGDYTPIITIDDPGDGDKFAIVDSTASVSVAPISVDAPDFTFQEGQVCNGFIATLTDSAGACATGNYAGSFSIDATSYNDLVFASLGNGSYSIQCTDIPTLEPGNYSATLEITETGQFSSVMAGPANFSINVTDAPLTASAVNISATAGVPFTGTVATFTDADPNRPGQRLFRDDRLRRWLQRRDDFLRRKRRMDRHQHAHILDSRQLLPNRHHQRQHGQQLCQRSSVGFGHFRRPVACRAEFVH